MALTSPYVMTILSHIIIIMICDACSMWLAGKRTWPAFRDWISACLEPSLEWWFGGVTVITDWQGSPHDAPSADGKYIFGFHPHGLYPTGKLTYHSPPLCIAKHCEGVVKCVDFTAISVPGS